MMPMANICHGVQGPWENRTLRGQHGHGAHQEAGLAAQGHAGDDGQSQDGLELRQHEEGGAARHAQGAERGHQHQLTGLRLPSLEHQEEGHHAFQQHQRRR